MIVRVCVCEREREREREGERTRAKYWLIEFVDWKISKEFGGEKKFRKKAQSR